MDSLLSNFWPRQTGREMKHSKRFAARSPTSHEQLLLVPTASQECSAARQFDGLTEVNQPSIKVSDDLNPQVQNKESELSLLRHEYSHLFRVHQATINENQDLKKRALQTEQELESTRARVTHLKHKIQVCKDDLFNMQPRGKRPDSEIAQAYNDLHEHISIWMEGEISKFEANWEKHHRRPLPDMFHHGDVDAVKNLLLAYPKLGGEYVVRCILQAGLQKLVFARDILFLGLKDSSTALLRQIEKSILDAKHPQGRNLIILKFRCSDDTDIDWANIWLADALAALSRTSDLEQNRQSAYVHITTTLFKDVAKFFSIIENSSQSLQLLCNEVVRPAIKLADMIRTSPTSYGFGPTMSEIDLFEEWRLGQQHLSELKLIDVVTGKTLNAGSPAQPDKDGYIGTQIMVLAPALYRCDSGQAPLELVKELDVVKLHKPLGRRRAATARQEPTNEGSLI
ncbi:MAG: hypothetical protein Q9224_005815 [Gallowayella concinna]